MNEYLIALFEQQWRDDPKSRVFLRLAEEYRKGEAYDKAIQVCEEGIKAHPSYIPALVCLGRSLRMSNRLDEAEETFRKVLGFNPDNPHALRGLGFILEEKGNREEALSFYETSLLQEPGDEEITARINSLREQEQTQVDSFIVEDTDETEVFTMEDLPEEEEITEMPDPDEPEPETVEPAESATIEAVEDPVPTGQSETDLFEAPIEELDEVAEETEKAEEKALDDIDVEFERALQDDEQEPIFDGAQNNPQPAETSASDALLPEHDLELTLGLKHERLEHYEESQGIYKNLLAIYPKHPSISRHLERVHAIMDGETRREKKIRLLSNWLDRIKGVYGV